MGGQLISIERCLQTLMGKTSLSYFGISWLSPPVLVPYISDSPRLSSPRLRLQQSPLAALSRATGRLGPSSLIA